MAKPVSCLMVVLLLASSVCLISADTWTGRIGDKMCGADHPKGQDAAKCTSECIKHGSPYIFIVGKDKVYDIENQKDEKIAAELAKHAGHTVEVTCTTSSDGKSIKIESIKMPQAK